MWRKGKHTQSTSGAEHGTMGVSGKELCATELWAGLVPFHGIFSWNKWQTMVSQTCILDRHFLENKVSLTTNNSCCQLWNSRFPVKIRIVEILYLSLSIWKLPVLKDFCLELGGGTNKCNLFNTVLQMSQHSEELHNLVNQYFPNDQCVIFYPKDKDDQWILENTKSSMMWFQISYF